MIWKRKMREAIYKTKRSARIIAVLTGAVIAVAAAGYLFFHNPHQYPLPCLFHIITGLYCPGCGAGRASYSILHGRFYMAFRYNPMYVTLLPFLGVYIVARLIDWVLTGGNHVDQKLQTFLRPRRMGRAGREPSVLSKAIAYYLLLDF